MAESVDATVSNTVGATHPGSSPGPGTAHGGEHHKTLPAVVFTDGDEITGVTKLNINIGINRRKKARFIRDLPPIKRVLSKC